jgi:voltage-gated potassium channel
MMPGSVRDRMRHRATVAVSNRRVFPYLVAVTAITAVVTGVIAYLIDRKDFPTVEIGIWWAIVTLGTVGYGDVVPHTTWGRVLGSIVIVCGVTFISFVIAIVTSMFVDARGAEREAASDARHQEALALLQQLNERLERLENAGTERRDA